MLKRSFFIGIVSGILLGGVLHANAIIPVHAPYLDESDFIVSEALECALQESVSLPYSSNGNVVLLVYSDGVNFNSKALALNRQVYELPTNNGLSNCDLLARVGDDYAKSLAIDRMQI